MQRKIKTQEKIKNIIANSLGCNLYEIDPETLRNKGYNIVVLTIQQTLKVLKFHGKHNIVENIRKPEAPKDSILILFKETGFEKDNKGYSFSRYWVEIPKKIALLILTLNYLPDLNKLPVKRNK